MKILWITNGLFEEYYATKGQRAAFTGGWMRSLALKLKEIDPTVELAVASRVKSASQIEEVNNGGFIFYALPGVVYRDTYDASIERHWKEVYDRFRPDVVHIHGSEFPHGLAYVNAVGGQKVMVSIQGIVSRYARYYTAGIKHADFFKNITLHDFLLASSPIKGQKTYERMGKLEEELLRKVSHIIGRTSWDRDHSWAINPNATYHFCNETLREPFYSDNKWIIEKCQRHRIFLSQAAKPIKGMHKLIEALPLVLRNYPDTEVYVAGCDFVNTTNLHDILRFSSYGKYIKSLIKSNKLEEKVHFTGMIDADRMAEQYRKANVFVCPSSIENSPNSLGEAQLVGCPVVASYVGGVPDMVEDNVTGLLYRFEETEMLAAAICRVFADDELANRLSENGIIVAHKRHDGIVNATRMIEIYNTISQL